MVIKTLKILGFTLLMLIILLGGLAWYSTSLGLGNGYRVNWDWPLASTVSKDDEIVVEAAVVNVDGAEDYVAGLRMPTGHVNCVNTDSKQTILYNEQRFFIINSLTGERMDFDEKVSFDAQLEVLGLSDKIFLDHGIFAVTWQEYQKSQPNIC